MMKSILFTLLAGAALHAAAPPTELKDAGGKTIIQYVVEAPENAAPANTTIRRASLGSFSVFRSTTGPWVTRSIRCAKP